MQRAPDVNRATPQGKFLCLKNLGADQEQGSLINVEMRLKVLQHDIEVIKSKHTTFPKNQLSKGLTRIGGLQTQMRERSKSFMIDPGRSNLASLTP